MSTTPTDRQRARKRAAITLAILAVAALLLSGGMLALSGGSHHVATSTVPPAAPTDPATTAPTTAAPSSAAPTSHPATTTAAPAATCAATPCVLQGDAGNVVAAVSAFRKAAGLPAVTGSMTPAAGACALQNGNAASCPQSYYWTPVPALNGAQVVAKIAAFGNGRTWLLAPGLTRVAVGCAQTGPGAFQCAVVDVSPPH